MNVLQQVVYDWTLIENLCPTSKSNVTNISVDKWLVVSGKIKRTNLMSEKITIMKFVIMNRYCFIKSKEELENLSVNGKSKNYRRKRASIKSKEGLSTTLRIRLTRRLERTRENKK